MDIFVVMRVYRELGEEEANHREAVNQLILFEKYYIEVSSIHESYGVITNTRVYPKVSGLTAWSENCKWNSSLPLDAVVSLFCQSV
jgi:hypothetical protein